MIREGRYKYIHYVGYEPELFDLFEDPEELDNVAQRPEFAHVVDEYERKLRAILDPEGTDMKAKADQGRLIAECGGRQAILDGGGRSATPAPV